jgi:hypothetical protein
MATRLCEAKNVPEHIRYVTDFLEHGKYFDTDMVEICYADEEEKRKGPFDRVRIYTEKRVYTICVSGVDAKHPRGAVIGFMANRAPRPGETWTRGSDIRDGSLDKDTLSKLLLDILSCEMLPVKPDIQPIAVEEAPTGPAL